MRDSKQTSRGQTHDAEITGGHLPGIIIRFSAVIVFPTRQVIHAKSNEWELVVYRVRRRVVDHSLGYNDPLPR